LNNYPTTGLAQYAEHQKAGLQSGNRNKRVAITIFENFISIQNKKLFERL
jgi:hypothetical protein